MNPPRVDASVRWFAAMWAAVLVMALAPLAGALAQQDDQPGEACPVDAPPAGFTDRDEIPTAHAHNVDCAAELNIVTGFEDDTYRPRLAVRRDQMASFIAQGLDAAGVSLPSGDENQFTDVTTGPHRVNVNRLAEAGIVRGGPQDLPAESYGSGLHTRRDQMASFLMRAAGYALHDNPAAFEDDVHDPEDQAFDDVPPANVHFGNVNAAADAGLARGFPDGRYQPGQSTARDQMATFVVRLLNFLADVPPPDDDDDGNDDDDDEPAPSLVLTTSDAFTVPEGVNQMTVAAWGAGGAGGGAPGARGGGGGGSYCEATIQVTPGGEYVVTVGFGGTPEEPDGEATLVLGPAEQTVVHALGGGGGTLAGGEGGGIQACPAAATSHAGGPGGDPGVGPFPGGGGGGGSAGPQGPGSEGQSGAGAIGGSGGSGYGSGGSGGHAGEDGVSGEVPGGGGGGKGQGVTQSGFGAGGQVTVTWGSGAG